MREGLECDGVRVGEVLRDVALTVAPGEVVALTAPSGVGKSTLLRAIVRLVALDGGVVTLDGVDVATLDPRVLRRRVGFVAQRPVMLPGTVADNLAYGLDEPPDMAAALDAAGLENDFAVRDASKLSGGEQARVAIARALTRKPEVLLLDEPTSGLDAPLAEAIGRHVRELAAGGLAICLTSHDRAVGRRLGGPGGATCRDEPRRWHAPRWRGAVSDVLVQGLAGIALAVVRWGWRGGSGSVSRRELAVAAARAVVQLTAVGAVIVVIFEVPALAFAFVAVMLTTAAFTAGRRSAESRTRGGTRSPRSPFPPSSRRASCSRSARSTSRHGPRCRPPAS